MQAKLETITLQILTYNVFMRPPLISNICGDNKDDRLEMLTQVFPPYDAIALQEMFASFSPRINVLEQYAQNNQIYYARGPQRSLKHLVDGGLFLLSKWQILFTQSMVFTSSFNVDSLSAKGALFASLKHKEKDVVVNIINTHLQASYGNIIEEKVRVKQVNELLKFIQKFDSKNTLVLLGDFNISDLNAEYENLLNSLSCNNKYHVIDVFQNCSLKTHGNERLDYCFLLHQHSTKPNCTVISKEVKPFAVDSKQYLQLSGTP